MGEAPTPGLENSLHSNGSPPWQDPEPSSPQCEKKRPVCSGSEQIASWIAGPDLFWKTEEAGGDRRHRRNLPTASERGVYAAPENGTTFIRRMASDPKRPFKMYLVASTRM